MLLICIIDCTLRKKKCGLVSAATDTVKNVGARLQGGTDASSSLERIENAQCCLLLFFAVSNLKLVF